MPKKALIPLAVVAAVLISATLYFEVFRKAGADSGRLDGSGTIEATEIEISSKIAGRIAALPFEEGATVRKGDLIVRLEYDELQAQKQMSAASLENAAENLRRAKELYSAGSVSRKELDNAQTAYRLAKASDDLASATIQNAVIYSPIDGTVLSRNLEAGETAFPGSVILSMADLKKLSIRIYVDEKRVGLVKPGMKAVIRVDSWPDTGFDGTVTVVSSKAEFTPRTIQTKEERVKLMFAVKISLDNPDLKLKPGMPADAVIILEEKK